jgi:hypothetical protein
LSKLSKLIGIGEEVDIAGEKLTIYPLTMKVLPLIERLTELDKRKNNLTDEERKEITKISKELIKASFRDEYFTDEEMESMDLSMYSELSTAVINQINKMKNGKGLARIRELKEQAVQQTDK